VEAIGKIAVLSLFKMSGWSFVKPRGSTALSLLKESGLGWDRRVTGRAKCRNFIGLAFYKHSKVRREDSFRMEVGRIVKGLNLVRKGLLKMRRVRGLLSADVRNRVMLLVVEEGVGNLYI
jgi:hypothetical protein